jgi:hypothetical protein
MPETDHRVAGSQSSLTEDLTAGLRQVLQAAGRPPLRVLAAKTSSSPSTLSRLLSGKATPAWGVVREFLIACDVQAEGDLALWRDRVMAAQAERQRQATAEQPKRSEAITASPAVAADRIAEIIVSDSSGRDRRASGYRVTHEAVLTTAHAVADAAQVVVRFNAARPDVWSTVAETAWLDAATDLAVLRFVPPARASRVATARYARLAGQQTVIDVWISGFPRWKTRHGLDGSPFRDLASMQGTAPVLANRRSSTLEIEVAPPAEDRDQTRSPWEGFSGAPVWCEDRIIGVVSSHNRSEGLGRLHAVRLDTSLEAAGSPVLAELLGIPDVGLTDVVPRDRSRQTGYGYLEQVRDIAPAHGLVDRTADLHELNAFCEGDEDYLHIQGPPWSGKSALLSTFALNPPTGVDVVAFFVTGRLAGYADSTAFTEALLDQLAALVGDFSTAPATGTVLDARRRALLTTAAKQVRQTGRRLVLVVDGLDEDRGAVAGSGLPSIASQLPKSPKDGLRIIVTSRTGTPLPADVAVDHPLRSCRVHHLAPSTHAGQVRGLARRELSDLLAGEQLHQDLIAFLCASQSGLTLSDLEEVTEQPRFVLENVIAGALGRVVATDRGEFRFIHEVLRAQALDLLGERAVTRYRNRLRQIIES